MERDTDIELRLLIEAIYLKYSYDFRDYSGASIKRRVQHALSQFECATISALQEKVLHDPTAFMQLLQLLTIPVSEMFRDPSHFLAIRQEVVPLLAQRAELRDVRIDNGEKGGELKVHVDRERAAAFGFNAEQVTKYTFLVKEVQIPENHLLLQTIGASILRNYFVFDYYWRLYRNLVIRKPAEISALYEGPVHPIVKTMLEVQSSFSPSVLKNGIVSKLLMTATYIRSLLIKP